MTDPEQFHADVDGVCIKCGSPEDADDVCVPGCEVCETADRTGWFGSNDSHCRACHRTWRGTAQIHCVTCHAHFSSVSACNKHEGNNGVCLDPATARNKKTGDPLFTLIDRYGGPTWATYSGERPGHWTLERRL